MVKTLIHSTHRNQMRERVVELVGGVDHDAFAKHFVEYKMQRFLRLDWRARWRAYKCAVQFASCQDACMVRMVEGQWTHVRR